MAGAAEITQPVDASEITQRMEQSIELNAGPVHDVGERSNESRRDSRQHHGAPPWRQRTWGGHNPEFVHYKAVAVLRPRHDTLAAEIEAPKVGIPAFMGWSGLWIQLPPLRCNLSCGRRAH